MLTLELSHPGFSNNNAFPSSNPSPSTLLLDDEIFSSVMSSGVISLPLSYLIAFAIH